jgi:hypothetical protein
VADPGIVLCVAQPRGGRDRRWGPPTPAASFPSLRKRPRRGRASRNASRALLWPAIFLLSHARFARAQRGRIVISLSHAPAGMTARKTKRNARRMNVLIRG